MKHVILNATENAAELSDGVTMSAATARALIAAACPMAGFEAAPVRASRWVSGTDRAPQTVNLSDEWLEFIVSDMRPGSDLRTVADVIVALASGAAVCGFNYSWRLA